MASPLKTGKQSVNMAGPVRVSRIRRDPPPVAKKIAEADVDPEERDTQMVIIGVVGFALALFVIAIGFSTANGWSAGEYTINLSNL